MKKTFMKASTVTLLCLSSQSLCFAQTSNPTEFVSSNHYTEQGILKGYSVSPLSGMQNLQNLKAYHCGTRVFNSEHTIPTKEDLLNHIESHPFFIGAFDKELSKNEAKVALEEKGTPFFFYERKEGEKLHFYLAHKDGVRHFTIGGGDGIGCLDNSGQEFYPSLKSFIQCTLS